MYGMCGVSLQVRKSQCSGKGHPEVGSGECSIHIYHLVQECIKEFKHERQSAIPVAAEIVRVWHHSVDRVDTKMSV